jgi:hypothetical protein
LPEAQIAVGFALADSVGSELTVIATTAVFVQLAAFDPVTVKLVEVIGETETFGPVNPPGFQVKEVAPDAVKVVD